LDLSARIAVLRSGFNRSFWVGNVLELFERFAFYGSKAVLAVYLVERLGLGPLGSSLMGLYGFAIFFLPVLAGPFVDRYGFRRSLLACFSLFTLGYLSIGLAALPAGRPLVALFGLKGWVVFSLVLTALGGSLIKPSIVGTVARTTDDSTKSLGYSIYYTLVNVGGMVGPLLALPVREGFGIEYVLVLSSGTSFLNLVGAFLFFREPASVPAAGAAGAAGTAVAVAGARSLGRVIGDMLLVFRNLRFISFLVLFSGFWIMFWQIFYSVPFYVRDVLGWQKFELFEAIGPFTIILLTVPVTALMKRVRPVAAMTAAFAVATLSWLLPALFPTVWAMAAAIALFSVGETLQAPRFYEYVADIAPKEQVGTFMGFAFLPVAIGALVAGPLSGWLVQHFLKEGRPPAGMWFVLAGIGVASTAGMLLYDRFLKGSDLNN